MGELDATTFQIACDLIDLHGDQVFPFLFERISQLMAAVEMEQVAAWVVIRNVVVLLTTANDTVH